MTIAFQNKGLVDRRAITAFGVSSKDNSSAIGYFGTGLKYAIAILMRHRQKFTIYIGLEPLKFGYCSERVRLHDFEFVTINGRLQEFTTDVGKNWQLWMALRELWCNCIDERGEAGEDLQPKEGYTTMVVEGDEFEEVWDSRGDVILQTEPIAKTDKLHIHAGGNKYVYYKGIRVCELPLPALFTYDIKESMTLTEDRTLMYPHMVNYVVGRAILELSNQEVIRAVVTAADKTLEQHLCFDGMPSQTFLKTVEPLALAFHPMLNKSAVQCCRSVLNRRVKAERRALPPHEAALIDKAVGFCRRIGFPVDEYPIVLSEYIGEGVLGSAEDGTIYISRIAMMRGTKVLASTLVEEWVHLKYFHTDESRGMQNYLFDVIMGMGEKLTGEIL